MPKTVKKSQRSRIEMYRAIINTPCTSPNCVESGVCGHEGEKAAARAQLARILSNVKERQGDAAYILDDAEPGKLGSREYYAAWAEIMERGYDDHGNEWWVGAKNRRASHTGPVTYAQAIREDIRMARRAARFPLVDPTSGGAALSIQAVELYHFDPIGQAPPEIKINVRKSPGAGIDIIVKNIPIGWGWHENKRADRNGKSYTDYGRTDELKELGRELHRVANAYNASYGSNVMTDCHAYAFTASVLAENPHGWHTVL